MYLFADLKSGAGTAELVATGGAPEHHLSWRPLADEARTKTIRLRPRHFELTVRSTPCALHRLAHSGEFVRADSVGDASGLEVEAAFIPAAEPDEPQGEFSITVNEEFTLNLRAADVDTLTRWLSALHAMPQRTRIPPLCIGSEV